MSLTPLAGLSGATRSGSIDPAAILHVMKQSNLSIDDAESLLNKKSGWKALTGTTSFGDIVDSKDADKKLAFDLFVDRILDFVGAYYLKLGGQVDALVFAGGIGEKSAQLRQAVADKCACLGFRLDDMKNKSRETQSSRRPFDPSDMGGKVYWSVKRMSSLRWHISACGTGSYIPVTNCIVT
jgi:acetate kinase